MEGLLTSALMLSGGASDLTSSELGPLIERYFRDGAGEGVEETAKRFKNPQMLPPA